MIVFLCLLLCSWLLLCSVFVSEGFLKVFDLLLHSSNPVCQEHGFEPACPVAGLAGTWVRTGEAFELAQTDLDEKLARSSLLKNSA